MNLTTLLQLQVKGQVHPRTGHERPEGSRVQFYSFFNLGAGRGSMINATPRPLYPREWDPVSIVQEARWVPGPVWKGAVNRPHWNSILGPFIAIPTTLSRPTLHLQPKLMMFAAIPPHPILHHSVVFKHKDSFNAFPAFGVSVTHNQSCTPLTPLTRYTAGSTLQIPVNGLGAHPSLTATTCCTETTAHFTESVTGDVKTEISWDWRHAVR
jgi:hypothetical protein